MKIALDYDDTYTRDPLLWNWFVAEAIERGHTVYCVTSRKETMLDEIELTLGRLITRENIIACGYEPKRAFTQDLDIMIDVWIDDNPEMIGNTTLLRGLDG